MKASDFNMARDLRLDFEKGLVRFQETRMVVFDADAMGLLRQKMLEQEGLEKTRRFFLQLGFHNGYNDFLRMKKHYHFDNELELLISGPVIHTWEGHAHAQPTQIHYDRAKGEMLFAGHWMNSWEAEQHLSFNGPSQESVCWSLAGYASGWTSAFFGAKVICVEPACMGKGDPHCTWKIAPPSALGKDAELYSQALEEF